MKIAVDFDNTLVERDPPLRLKPGVLRALLALRTAGHELLLYSARSNRAMRFNPDLDPLCPETERRWREALPDPERLRVQEVHQKLHADMVAFVNAVLPGVFNAIDDGAQGKPLADLFIDDKALNPLRAGGPTSSGWDWIARTYGALP